jgi:hypothetical protein
MDPSRPVRKIVTKFTALYPGKFHDVRMQDFYKKSLRIPVDLSSRIAGIIWVNFYLPCILMLAIYIGFEVDSTCFWYYLIGEGYEKDRIYALPLYRGTSSNQIRAYLHGEDTFLLVRKGSRCLKGCASMPCGGSVRR